MDDDVLEKKEGRFFFDRNVFDEDHEEEVEEDLPPPPPTFSEQELEQAKNHSFEQGKAQGLKEAAASREQYVAKVLDKITQALPQIFEQEGARENRYEQEAVSLATAIFSKLFPVFQRHHGLEELKDTLSTILQKQEGQKEIQIHVHKDARDGIDAHIETLRQAGLGMRMSVISDDTMEEFGIKLVWDDGGAVKDSQNLADEIAQHLSTYIENPHQNPAVPSDETSDDSPTAPAEEIKPDLEKTEPEPHDTSKETTEEPQETVEPTIESDEMPQTDSNSDIADVQSEAEHDKETSEELDSKETMEKPDE